MTLAFLARGFVLMLCVLTAPAVTTRAQAQDRHQVRGLVLSVDRPGKALVVSHENIDGLMDAMVMPFDVRNAADLDGIEVGSMIQFTLVMHDAGAYVENLRVRAYESVEQDPLTASRLRVLTDTMRPPTSPRVVAAGQPVPDFTLTDQTNTRVSLSSLRGRTIVVNFIYTSCALPQFCFRIANHFGALQRRFQERMGRDLVLLTVTFDPEVDRPERLARYAAQWKASPASWHFLTGGSDEVRAVCDLFGVDAFRDEGLMNHSVRTAVIDRTGRLVTNIAGNTYTARQLGDLVDTVLSR